jgi:hypothetical protein
VVPADVDVADLLNALFDAEPSLLEPPEEQATTKLPKPRMNTDT